ncbi:MAG: class I SAM-dependent methyltransferase [Candidatus Zixiibacteriota bacterium]|nr:MAG: class I SAM-dependent methyltransferase [candidate division Zixibacteria bacterium]
MLLTKFKLIRLMSGILETANFLFLKLLFKKPQNIRLFPGRIFRNYMSLVGQDKWLCKSIFELFPGISGKRIILEHLTGEGIETPLDELAYLALITAVKKPENIFEIGTFRGRTALNFALNSPENCTVYTMDLPPNNKNDVLEEAGKNDKLIIKKSEPDIEYKGKGVEYKIKQIYGDSTKFDFSPYYGKMDIVFIDGAHHYNAVIIDTKNAIKMIKQDGVIIWHDFAIYGDYNDVTRAVLDCIPSNRIIQIDSTTIAIYFPNPNS